MSNRLRIFDLASAYKSRISRPWLVTCALLLAGCSGFLNADPTATPPPTATAAPPPTATPAEVSTAEFEESFAGRLDQLSDGRFEYIDDELNFRVVFPLDWVAITPDKLDLDSMQALLSENDPELAQATGPLLEQFPEIARVMAFETNPEQLTLGFLPTLGIVGLEGIEFAVLPLDFLTETTAQSTLATFEQAELLSSGVDDELWVQPVGRIELRLPIVTESGEAIMVRETLIIVQSNNAIFTLTLAAEENYFGQLDGAIESVLGEFELTELSNSNTPGLYPDGGGLYAWRAPGDCTNRKPTHM